MLFRVFTIVAAFLVSAQPQGLLAQTSASNASMPALPSLQWTVPIQIQLVSGPGQPTRYLDANSILNIDLASPMIVRFSVNLRGFSFVSWNLSTPSGNLEFQGKDFVELQLDQPGSYAMTVAVTPFPDDSEAEQAPTIRATNTAFGLVRLGATWNQPLLPSATHQMSLAPSDQVGLITVAVLDTGVNYNHPDLKGRFVLNPLDASVDGDDNDHNGYVDDIIGWDFIDGDAFPSDDTGHGTLIAGLVARDPSVRLLPVKVTSALHESLGPQVAAGIRYAVARGAKILIFSFGSFDPRFRDEIMPALIEAQQAGALMIAAAGNQRTDIDVRPRYPASIELPNLISVGSVDRLGHRSVFSNYGARSVPIAAYGGNATAVDAGPEGPSYLSQGVSGTFRHSGTSFAAPVAATHAAHYWHENPSASAVRVKQYLIDLASAADGIGIGFSGLTHL